MKWRGIKRPVESITTLNSILNSPLFLNAFDNDSVIFSDFNSFSISQTIYIGVGLFYWSLEISHVFFIISMHFRTLCVCPVETKQQILDQMISYSDHGVSNPHCREFGYICYNESYIYPLPPDTAILTVFFDCYIDEHSICLLDNLRRESYFMCKIINYHTFQCEFFITHSVGNFFVSYSRCQVWERVVVYRSLRQFSTIFFIERFACFVESEVMGKKTFDLQAQNHQLFAGPKIHSIRKK